MKENLTEIVPLDDDEVIEQLALFQEQANIIKRLTVPFAVADVANSNGRTYSSNILRREVGRMKEKIESLRIPGNLEHPRDGITRVDKIAYCLEV